MGPPRLWSALAALLFLIHTATAIVITNTQFNIQFGVPFTITWSEATAGSTVAIDLYGGENPDNLFILQGIASNVQGTSFTWTPPTDIPQRNAYAIVVSDGTNTAISFAFTITTAPTTTSITTTVRPTTSTPLPTPSSILTTTATPLAAPTRNSTNPATQPHSSSIPPPSPTSAADILIPNVPGATRGSTDEVLSLPAKIGIGLAAGVGMAAILLGSVFMVKKKNRELQQQKELEAGSAGGSLSDLGGGTAGGAAAVGWKAAEKRPATSGSRAGSVIELGEQKNEGAGRNLTERKSLGDESGRLKEGEGRKSLGEGRKSLGEGRKSMGDEREGRLTVSGRATLNQPRTPSPLAREVKRDGEGERKGR